MRHIKLVSIFLALLAANSMAADGVIKPHSKIECLLQDQEWPQGQDSQQL